MWMGNKSFKGNYLVDVDGNALLDVYTRKMTFLYDFNA